MSSILTQYALAAFPPGGSECAAASREALQQMAEILSKADEIDTHAQINTRQRPMMKSALNWFYTVKDSTLPSHLNDEMHHQLFSQLEK